MFFTIFKRPKKKFFDQAFRKKNKIQGPEDIKSSQYFCIVPWLHIHALPDSNVIPCCVSSYEDSYGNLKSHSLKEIWNNKRFKTMRRLKVMDRPVHGCHKCYEIEKSGIESMRKRLNRDFAHHYPILSQTQIDGHVKDLKMRYLDIRFSNICNFKCRGCSPALSTKWYEDFQKLWDEKSNTPKLMNTAKDSPTLWNELEQMLPYIETAYFAGGEPLLMDEHYHCLEKLITLKKTDINLQYNTNLSVLKFKKYDLLQIWRHFKSVDLNVSLDDIETRGEYFRAGLDWEKFLHNFKQVRDEFPHFNFQVNCTINIFNIHRIPEIHTTLLKHKLIDPEGFNFNTLLDPPHYRTQVLPSRLKKERTIKLKAYMRSVDDNYPGQNWEKFKTELSNQIHFMNSADLSKKLSTFRQVTKKLDQIRNQNFCKTYPELQELYLNT
ncbi:MAG: hypothetical protein CME66_08640 [Halobacteriovoraceae bacterium]|nr:hypothetical protein [Halobacteriovoraceae bacterium]